MNPITRIEIVKDLVQETVDRGVTAAEDIHQTIAAVPFAVLGDPLGIGARQRRLLSLVYGAVREVNRQVGEFLSDQFEAFEEGRDVSARLDEVAQSGSSRSPR